VCGDLIDPGVLEVDLAVATGGDPATIAHFILHGQGARPAVGIGRGIGDDPAVGDDFDARERERALRRRVGFQGATAVRQVYVGSRRKALSREKEQRAGTGESIARADGAYVRPGRTLTLALPKTGLAAAATGELVLADIGIPAGVYERAGISYRTLFLDGYRMR